MQQHDCSQESAGINPRQRLKLSTNFRLSEFTRGAGQRIKPTAEQIFCIQTLCSNVLQPTRDKFGTITILSGLRTAQTTRLLISQGYYASMTSDHIAWGVDNPVGTGAADFTCLHNLDDVFNWLINDSISLIGQIIYYPNNKFIHCSNRFNNIFCSPDTRSDATRVLISKNGKLYPYKK